MEQKTQYLQKDRKHSLCTKDQGRTLLVLCENVLHGFCVSYRESVCSEVSPVIMLIRNLSSGPQDANTRVQVIGIH